MKVKAASCIFGAPGRGHRAVAFCGSLRECRNEWASSRGPKYSLQEIFPFSSFPASWLIHSSVK